MSTATAMSVGALMGVLFVMTCFLSVLVRFVSADMDGFRRWLDRA